MTNTLHRYGDAESQRDDYVVFAMPSRGLNDEGSVEKLKAFLRLALRHEPVNVGDARHGSQFMPATSLTPFQLYVLGRRDAPDPQRIVEGIDSPGSVQPCAGIMDM